MCCTCLTWYVNVVEGTHYKKARKEVINLDLGILGPTNEMISDCISSVMLYGRPMQKTYIRMILKTSAMNEYS